MTERAKKLLLLYYKQSRKIRRVSGLPPLTFKAKKAGNLKNYRIYGNTETLTRSYSGSAPHSFPIEDGSVSNYRIYGNTVNGESVGDLVESGEHAGEYKVAVTVEGKNLFNENSLISPIFVRDHYLSWYFDDEHYLLATDKSIDDRPWSYDYSQIHIALSSGTYTIQLSGVAASNQFAGIYITNSNNDRICSENISGKTSSVMTFTLNTPETIGIEIKVLDGKYRIMLVEGSTPLPYEPYQPPVTTPIYLPEPIKMVGDEAEYIDYAEQKQYRIGADDIDVTLPELPTLAGTNVMTVGTEVQPSSVAVEVNEILSCGDKITDNQSVNYGKYKIPVTLTADSAETTDIYLDEPLAKSGNNADYIDYATQKRHNSDGTESSVTLPEISTLAGTNTLTVGTEVQPSGVEIKGRIKAAGGD